MGQGNPPQSVRDLLLGAPDRGVPLDPFVVTFRGDGTGASPQSVCDPLPGGRDRGVPLGPFAFAVGHPKTPGPVWSHQLHRPKDGPDQRVKYM